MNIRDQTLPQIKSVDPNSKNKSHTCRLSSKALTNHVSFPTPVSPALPCRLFVVVTVIMECSSYPCVLTRSVYKTVMFLLSVLKAARHIIAWVWRDDAVHNKLVVYVHVVRDFLRCEQELTLLQVKYYGIYSMYKKNVTCC